jgi:hypothetical protein
VARGLVSPPEYGRPDRRVTDIAPLCSIESGIAPVRCTRDSSPISEGSWAVPGIIVVVVTLEVIDETQINLPWHHFISVLTFAAAGPASDAALLRCLVGHSRYRNSYVGSVEVPEGLHWPYLTETIPADPYDPSAATAAHLALLSWLYQHTYELPEPPVDIDVEALSDWLGSVAGTTLETMPILAADPRLAFASELPALFDSHVVTPLSKARAVYQLRDLPGSLAPDELVFNADGFLEFVAIDYSGTTVTLIVATDD